MKKKKGGGDGPKVIDIGAWRTERDAREEEHKHLVLELLSESEQQIAEWTDFNLKVADKRIDDTQHELDRVIGELNKQFARIEVEKLSTEVWEEFRQRFASYIEGVEAKFKYLRKSMATEINTSLESVVKRTDAQMRDYARTIARLEARVKKLEGRKS